MFLGDNFTFHETNKKIIFVSFVGKVQEKVDSLSERTDRDGIIVGERGGLDQTDFDSFFTRNLLKQKCRYFLSQYLTSVF